MPLSPMILANELEQRWLAGESSQLPNSSIESGYRFAEAVTNWFGMAASAGIPCATATLKKPLLSIEANSALQAGSPALAGQQLGLAVANYIAGQAFGPGSSTYPAMASFGSVLITGVFADLEMETNRRAQQIADACTVMALSTMVVFPPPMTPSPIL